MADVLQESARANLMTALHRARLAEVTRSASLGIYSNNNSAAHTLIVIGFATLVLSWVAIYNRAPLVFSDSLMYATAALELSLPVYFSVFYSWLIWPFHVGHSLWPVVFVQSAFTAHLLYLVVRVVAGSRRAHPIFPIVTVGLAALTSLPWLTGQLLPDVASPVVILGIFLLSFSRNRMRIAEQVYIWIVTTLAIATHLSHVPLALGLIMGTILAQRIARSAQFGISSSLILLSTVVTAASALGALTWFTSGQVGLTRDSGVFALAKLIDEGPALAYLKANCPDAPYQLCDQLQQLEGLSHDELKWMPWSPFRNLEPPHLTREANEIVQQTVLAYPWEILSNSLRGAGSQIIKFQTGDGLIPQFSELVAKHVGQFFGRETEQMLLESRQATGELHLARVRPVHTAAVIVAFCICGWSIVRWGCTSSATRFAAFIMGGVLTNALVTGALSGAYDRYMARVIWLLCIAAALCLAVHTNIGGAKLRRGE
jgi:hypothetical protein